MKRSYLSTFPMRVVFCAALLMAPEGGLLLAQQPPELPPPGQALAPDHAAVLIGLYRFYFYKGRLAEALDVAKVCLLKAADDCGLPADWRLVSPNDASFSDFEKALPRFYLFTLKGYAYLQMRLGNLEEGLLAVLKLLELDPLDKIGAKVLLEVLQRTGQDDHD